MKYTNDELSLIDGLLSSYMLSLSTPTTIRNAYLTVHQHLQCDHLTSDDLVRIKDGLYFLLPQFHHDRQMYREIISAIASTHAIIKGVA